MLQRKVWMKIEEMAMDRRITDKWFRWMFLELQRPNIAHLMIKDRMELLREVATNESERESRESKSESLFDSKDMPR